MDDIDQFILDSTTRKSHKIWDVGTAYLRNAILPTLNKPLPEYVVIWAVHQTRGRCYYKDRRITVPVWAFHKFKQNELDYARKNLEHLQWYLSHELAHMANWDEFKHQHDVHGPNFMRHLIRICPANATRFEADYKPRNTKAVGISEIDCNDL